MLKFLLFLIISTIVFDLVYHQISSERKFRVSGSIKKKRKNEKEKSKIYIFGMTVAEE